MTLRTPWKDQATTCSVPHELQRILVAVKKMPTIVCGILVAVQVKDLKANIQSLDVDIEKHAEGSVGVSHIYGEASSEIGE